MRKNILASLILVALTSCALMPKSKSKPINLSGNFKVSLDQSVKFFADSAQYPLAGTVLNDVPYLNNQIIPANSGIIGTYKNSGFRCSIVWTAIILPDNSSISNSKGVALSSCNARADLSESQVITAQWN